MFIQNEKLTATGWTIVLAAVVFFATLVWVNSQDYTPAPVVPVESAEVITSAEPKVEETVAPAEVEVETTETIEAQ